MQVHRIVLLLLVAALVAPASAHLVKVRDDPSCEAWSAARPKNAARLEAWVLGYVSGMAQSADFDVPPAFTSGAIVEWVDRYCKANPRRGVALAGVELFAEIRRSRAP